MCWQDHQLGREQRASMRLLRLSTASQAALPPDRHRAALIFDPPSAGTATLSISDPAVGAVGLTLRSTDEPIVLNVVQHGALVTSGWNVIASAGTPTMVVFESLLPKE